MANIYDYVAQNRRRNLHWAPRKPRAVAVHFAQIHDSGDIPNKPLLRLVWMKRREGVDENLWAVVRNSVDDDEYTWTHLSERPDRFVNFEIKIKENVLKVKINEFSELNKMLESEPEADEEVGKRGKVALPK